MAAQGAKRRPRRPPSARRGVAPLVIAAIIAAAVVGGTAAYLLTRPAAEQPLAATGAATLLDHLVVRYVVSGVFGIGQEYLEITVYLDANTTGPIDVYVLKEHSDGSIDVLSSHTNVANGTVIKTQYASGPLYVLAVQGGYVDAIVVGPPSRPGEVTVNSEHHPDPVSLAQHVKVKVRWWDIIWEQWRGAWGLASALKFTGQVVMGMLPYAGTLWMLWFVSAIVRALGEFSIEPVMDFFYKNYQIVKGIYDMILNVVLKIVDIITGPAS